MPGQVLFVINEDKIHLAFAGVPKNPLAQRLTREPPPPYLPQVANSIGELMRITIIHQPGLILMQQITLEY